MRVFISSRMNGELDDERESIIQTVMDIGHIPVKFENETADAFVAQWEKEAVLNSDVVLLVLHKSVSRPVYFEVETAMNMGVRLFIFVKDLPIILEEKLQNDGISASEFTRFCNCIKTRKLIVFSNKKELNDSVKKALASIPVKDSKIPEELVIPEPLLNKITHVYSSPIQYTDGKEKLDKEHFLLIIGPPHAGKTATALNLLLELRKVYKIEAMASCSTYEEANRLASIPNIGIFIDDPFGKVEFYPSLLASRLHEFCDPQKSENYFVVTSRDEIYRIAKKKTEIGNIGRFEEKHVVSLKQEESYDDDNLARILHKHIEYHLQQKKISQNAKKIAERETKKIISQLRFPHNIARFVEEELPDVADGKQSLEDAILHAKDIIREAGSWYSRLDRNQEYAEKYFVLSIALLNNQKRVIIENVYRLIIKELSDKYKLNIIPQSIDRLVSACGSYVTEDWSRIDFIHPSFLEGVLKEIGTGEYHEDLSIFVSCVFKTSTDVLRMLTYKDITGMVETIGQVAPKEVDAIRRLIQYASTLEVNLDEVDRLLEATDSTEGMNSKDVIPVIMSSFFNNAINHYNSNTRCDAIKAISALGRRSDPKTALRLLGNFKNDLHWIVRIELAKAVADVGRTAPMEAKSLLRELACDGIVDVRRVALQGIERLNKILS